MITEIISSCPASNVIEVRSESENLTGLLQDAAMIFI